MAQIEAIETEYAAAVLQAIKQRRSVGKVAEVVPAPELIEQILEAGTWAPNHHLTQPWRFFVLMGEARSRLGAALADAATQDIEDGDVKQKVWTAQAAKPLRAPVLIAIAVEPAPEEQAIEIEEIAAAAAAGQNMLLAAHALGLAAMWRSGRPAYSDQVREFFELSTRATVLGFIYLGYPTMDPPARERLPVASVTRWMT